MDKVLEGIRNVVSVVSPAAVGASIVYETGYFSVVGNKFQSFLSLGDYATSAIEWLPIIAAVYAPMIFLPIAYEQRNQIR